MRKNSATTGESEMPGKTIDTIDIDNSPDLLELTGRMDAASAPFILRVAGTMVGVIAPIG